MVTVGGAQHQFAGQRLRLDGAFIVVHDRRQLNRHRQRKPDGVFNTKVGILARELNGMHELACHALLAQGVVDGGLERHDAARLALHLVAVRRAGLDEELFLGETELAVRQRERDRPLGFELGDERRGVGLLERRLQGAEPLAEFGPEQAQVRLDGVGDELAAVRHDAKLFDVQLVAEDVAQALDGAPFSLGQRDDHLGERLPRLDGGSVARGASHLDDAPRRRHVEGDAGVDGRLVGHRPRAQVHAIGSRDVGRRKNSVDFLPHERCKRRHELGHASTGQVYSVR